MNEKQQIDLKEKCRDIRCMLIKAFCDMGMGGHVGGSLSIIEVLVALYYKHMNVNPKDPKMEGRDRLVLSKGHAGPALYTVLADKGYFPVEMLGTINKPETLLPSHADMLRTPGIDMTAGSLGQGISCAVGMAIGSRIKKDGATIYSIVGDGESNEGQVWEAAMLAGQQKLDNLIAFTDYNKQQLDGPIEGIINMAPLASKWEAFNWNTIEVTDGNDVAQVDAAITEAKNFKGKPSMIILNTIKGKGVSFIESVWNHSIPISPEDCERAIKEIRA